jgi:hypothetical protein
VVRVLQLAALEPGLGVQGSALALVALELGLVVLGSGLVALELGLVVLVLGLVVPVGVAQVWGWMALEGEAVVLELAIR